MITTEKHEGQVIAPETRRRSGYMAAIVVNAIMMVLANNIVDWGWLPFLTDEFNSLLWLINISLGATILANVVYMSYDPQWFKSLTQIGLNLISIVVTVRAYQVFPFDFSAYEFNWETLVRVVMIIGIVGTAIAIVVELVKLVRSLPGNLEPVAK